MQAAGGKLKEVQAVRNDNFVIMGNCASEFQEDFTSVVLPSFYDGEPMSPDEIEGANSSWKSILNDTAAGYLAAKNTPGFKHNSAMLYFFESFYERLFDIYPNARSKFKHGLKAQGKFQFYYNN